MGLTVDEDTESVVIPPLTTLSPIHCMIPYGKQWILWKSVRIMEYSCMK